MKNTLKEILWHLLVVAFFALFSIVYFYPVLENKTIVQHDYETAKGVASEAVKYMQKENRSVAWTNALFGGMPTYQIGGFKTYSFFYYLQLVLTRMLPYGTVSSLFLYLLGFYILLITLKFDRLISVIGAVAFGLSSYNIIIIAAGHISKTYAIAYMPIVVAGFLNIYDKKYIVGSIIAVLGLGLQLITGHIQIVYYTALTMGLFFIFSFFWHLNEKKLKDFAIATIFAAFAVILAILPNIGQFWRAYEAGQYSMRGKSDLTLNKQRNTKGLDYEYAFSWSYGVDESLSFLIPNAKGGATGYIGNNENAMKKVDNMYAEIISQQNHYWGNQPFTSGPVYFGAIILFLALLGMFIVDNKLKWWLMAATLLSIVLSWGKNFPIFNNFMFDYFPFYNKFRSVSMTLVIASLTIPLLATMTIKKIIENRQIIKTNSKYFWISLGLTAGIALILWIIPSIFSYITADEQKMFNDYLSQIPKEQHYQIYQIIDNLKEARIAIFRADAIRTFLYILFSAIVLFLFSSTNLLSKNLALGIVAFLIALDMWVIDRRYLGEKDFVSKRKIENQNKPTPVDEIILKDSDQYFRVLNLTTNPFTDHTTSLFHKSIGGYHGAKLMIYQELIDNYLSQEIQTLAKSFSDTTTTPYQVLSQLKVLNMLNTKYVIYSPNSFPLVNAKAYGNAWFVDNIKFVNSSNEEMLSLSNENLQRTAIINQSKFNIDELKSILPSNDTTRKITLKVYKPDYLEFDIITPTDAFVVFSDIYYPKWKAYVDDKEVKIYRTNYVLRGIKVPAGSKKIVMEFKPAAIFVAQKIEFASSIFLILVILGAILIKTKKCKPQNLQ